MRYLFVHDAFPGQFIHLLRYLLGQSGVEIVAASRKGTTVKLPIRQVIYEVPEGDSAANAGLHQQAAALGLDLYRKLQPIVTEGWTPDYVISHASTGASSFLRDLFPNARFTSFLEWYYGEPPVDEVKDTAALYQSFASNSATNSLLARDFDQSDAAYAPTEFQRSRFPRRWQRAMDVCHEGIDAGKYSPNADAVLNVADRQFIKNDEIITYAARGMEHSRGFSAFMKAIARVQQERPNLQVLIAAADRICYDPGGRGKTGLKNWAEEEVNFDPSRTHFVGLLPELEFVKMLQVSSLHVYLSIPFVLSWSCLNAMSTGLPVLASDNAPVQEVIKSGENGLLVDPNDVAQITASMMKLLDDNALAARLGTNARATILERFELSASIQRMLEIIHGKASPY